MTPMNILAHVVAYGLGALSVAGIAYVAWHETRKLWRRAVMWALSDGEVS